MRLHGSSAERYSAGVGGETGGAGQFHMTQEPNRLLESAPADLIPALKALDKSIDDAYWNCGQVTEVWCYSLLHPGEKLAEVQEHKLAMDQLESCRRANRYANLQSTDLDRHSTGLLQRHA